MEPLAALKRHHQSLSRSAGSSSLAATSSSATGGGKSLFILGVVTGASEGAPWAKPRLHSPAAIGATAEVVRREHRFCCGAAVP